MFNWACKACRFPQVATDQNTHDGNIHLSVGRTNIGNVGLVYATIRCLNVNCNKLSLTIGLREKLAKEYGWIDGEVIASWKLLPGSEGKPQPDYIPKAIREDYYEACAILNNSPKAAATLARRCLQGMIRDFCGVKKKTLFDEIEELKEQLQKGTSPQGVGVDSIEAIHGLRSLGNIGAHMEHDVDIIIDIDEGEATLLIELIENLFEEWYVARNQRQARFAKIAEIKKAKDAERLAKANPAES